jgi:hypothetical protein
MRDESKQSFVMGNVNVDISMSLTRSLTHTCEKRNEYNRTHLHNKTEYILTINFRVIVAKFLPYMSGFSTMVVHDECMNKVAETKIFFSEYFTFLLQIIFSPLSHDCN